MKDPVKDLLLEIGAEEIPAGLVGKAAADLSRLVQKALDGASLRFAGASHMGTPRRLIVVVHGMQARQHDEDVTITGPPVKVAFGEDGAPTRAAEGFARAQGVAVDELETMDTERGKVVCVRRHVRGREAADVLAEALPGVLGSLAFPKSMRWNGSTGPFVRPIHWICCVLDGEPVEFEFAGITSGRTSRGHRFLSPDPFEVGSPSDFAAELAERWVIACQDERAAMIREAMVRAEKETGFAFVADERLVAEVANLVEYPTLLVGRFDDVFLDLPEEVLVTAMRSHQRYFAMQDRAGRLVGRFGVVSNNVVDDMSVIVRGNERVLAARLYDARFFYEQDLKTGIEAMASRLGQRLFLKGAGDMASKAVRVKELAVEMCRSQGLDTNVRDAASRAADLCKADLMSQMVGEFPELQGVMGMHYARAAGEPEAVAAAIREHYLPRFAGDELPGTKAGAVLAVADRLDSIFTCFSAGAVPTGSRDPLGLRRQAIAVLKILVARDWDFPPSARPAGKVADFFCERFHGILTTDHSVPSDFANAVLAGFKTTRPASVVARAEALSDFSQRTEGFRDFLDNVFKRVLNILRKAEEEFPRWMEEARVRGLLEQSRDHAPDLDEDLEKAVEKTRVDALSAERKARETGDYQDLLDALYSFKEPLAAFFGTGRDGLPVLIAPTEDLRVRRLALVQRVLDLFRWFADFSRISTR